jgi:hypothetical protein
MCYTCTECAELISCASALCVETTDSCVGTRARVCDWCTVADDTDDGGDDD